jgi:hypothetical protein
MDGILSRFAKVGAALIFVALVALFPLSGQERLPRPARIFVAEMEGDLDGCFFVALNKLRRPMQIVILDKEEYADYVLTSTSIGASDRWRSVVFDKNRKNDGNVVLIRVRDEKVVWTWGEGDPSEFWARAKDGLPLRLAEALVEAMWRDLFAPFTV